MVLTTVIVDDAARTLNLLEPRPSGHVRQAVVCADLVDELTGTPVTGRVRVTGSSPGLSARSHRPSGVAGLVGVPSRTFPRLDAQPSALDVQIAADGYLPWTATVDIPQQAGFPETFDAVRLGEVLLRRRPVLLEVYVVRLTGADRPEPVAGAQVEISRVWRTVAAQATGGEAPLMLSLRQGVAQAWPAGTELESVLLVPDPSPDARLVRGVAVGERRLELDRLGAFATGDVVRLDKADPERLEPLRVEVPSGAGEPASPATLTTSIPTRVRHAAGTDAHRFLAPVSADPDAALTEPAAPGDTTVFVDDLSSLQDQDIVRAGGPGLVDEYLDSRKYRAVTDAAGRARLPELARVAAVEVTVTSGAQSTSTRISPDYSRRSDVLHLVLPS